MEDTESAKLAAVLACDKQWHVHTSDVLDGLRLLPDGCVQCVVTSPPYYALRDYQIEGQIGLEETPDAYVAKMVEVFREVRRVLRDDGTCWLNIGDSYSRGERVNNPNDSQRGTGFHDEITSSGGYAQVSKTGSSDGLVGRADRPGSRSAAEGIKPKDLIGIPWLLAFALRADGWYLRSEIIWHKPNPMPESVTDRPTKAHEQIFLLTKSGRYFYDAEAVKEAGSIESVKRMARGVSDSHKNINVAPGQTPHSMNQPRERTERQTVEAESRNKRSVWAISTKPYSEAHFATFPPEIPETCIKAGTSAKGCCPLCGSPWERVTEREAIKRERPNAYTKRTGEDGTGNSCANDVAGVSVKTTGWQPTCECGVPDVVPCLVVDPFNGAGTTGLVASKGLGLRYIGFELNPAYAEMARRRIVKGYSEVEKQKAASDGPLLFT